MADMFPSPGQPRRARGTVGHPYSALNLRLALAVFGMMFFGVLAVLLFSADLILLGWAAVGLALIGLVDAVVIQHRRSVRRRGDPEDHTSLFE